MDIFKHNAFKGNYLKAQDLGDNPLQIIIDSVSDEKVGDEMKPVVRIRGNEQGLVLNLTNANSLADILGTSETSEWVGRTVELYPTQTQFGTKVVPCIRVRAAVSTPPDLPFYDELPTDL